MRDSPDHPPRRPPIAAGTMRALERAAAQVDSLDDPATTSIAPAPSPVGVVRRPIGRPAAATVPPEIVVADRPTVAPRRHGRSSAVHRPIAAGTLRSGPLRGPPPPRRPHDAQRPPPLRRFVAAPDGGPTARQPLLSEAVCRHLGVVPLWMDEHRILVGIADPADAVAREVASTMLWRRARREVRFVACPRPRLLQAIDRTFAADGPGSLLSFPLTAPGTATPDVHTAPARADLARPRPVLRPTALTPRAAPEVVPEVEVGQVTFDVVDAPPDLADVGVSAGVPPTDTPVSTPPVAPPPAPLDSVKVRLGELMLLDGLISDDELEAALSLQVTTGARLGEILTHSAVVRESELSRTLASQSGLDVVDLNELEVQGEVARLIPQSLALRTRVVAIEETATTVTVAVSDPFDLDVLAQVREHLGRSVRFVVATDTQIDIALQAAYADDHVHVACTQLVENRPEESAATVLSPAQKRVGVATLVIALLSLALSPIAAIVAFNLAASVFYMGFAGYKLWLTYDSMTHDNEQHVTDDEIAALAETDLPVITILIPMYHEAAVVPKLVRYISRLDYPRTKLDVKLLLEADDDETLAAIRRLDLPPHFRTVIVPDAPPKTKPKACNYGLLLARGEITVIYDAEDEPDRDQLKKVVVAFAHSDPATVCIQCKLNYYNRTQNLLTRWFTMEYSMWFDVFLPGLDAHDSPIPLGGTSNHFMTEQLRGLGAWDPHNVAEDADLGIRLTKSGWRTAVVDSTTYEEANPDLNNWVRQRSRWVKGYMQTYLVHMRHPVELWRAVGARSFVSFQLVVGGTFIGFLLNPVYWTMTSIWTLTELGVIRSLFPGFVYYMSAVGLVIGNFLFAYLNAAGAMRRGYYDLVRYALLSPAYWGLMSWAAWKGAIQLITKPHYWEKTIHGLAERDEAEPAGGLA